MVLSDYLNGIIDNRGKNPERYFEKEKYPVIDNFLIKNELHPNIQQATRFIDEDTYQNFLRGYVYPNMVIMTLVGNGIGNVTTVLNTNSVIIQNTIGFSVKKNVLDDLFLYYFFRLKLEDIKQFDRGSGQPSIKKTDILNMDVNFPPLDTQKKIAVVLSALDDKIELNNKINQNLEAQARALFKSWFVDKSNSNRKKIKAEEFFNISIGKTPPRKEPEWFSDNPNDIKWVSISDMGNCGVYISDSSEYLISSAVSKLNIKIVPNNTVLLSFKLTVGRIAITDGEITTNEAIAHFVTDKKEINEYLYCYLKNFNFRTMGSTSSIATAVNSKIIKAMPFILPTDVEVKEFHSVTYPMFTQIKENQKENTYLAQLRDALLPKLMSGEIDVDKVDVSAITYVDELSIKKD